jgi:replicative DNA helicase
MQAHKAGHNVVFVTTEMGVEQIARRAAAIALGINPTLLKTGNISTHLLRRIQTYCQDFIGAERFRILSVGMNARVSVVDALCQEVGPSIVFIDGVYLLRPTDVGRNASRVERITGVFDEVKALTLDAGVPFVVTSQFNRQAGKSGKDGSLENIGYTDAVGTHSSIVVALKSGPTQNPAHSRVFDFLKGREGETGEVAINFKFAPLDMNEMSEEERQDEGVSTEESVAWMGMRRSAT